MATNLVRTEFRGCLSSVSSDRLEVVLLEVLGDLVAEHRSLNVSRAEVDASPHAGVDDLLEHVREPLEAPRGRDLLLNALTAILSVPKKFWSVFTNAPVAQAWPEGWSGKGGVKSGNRGLQTGVVGSNSGSHVGSAWVSGLPSVSASRIAVIGRQNCQ